MGTRYTKKNLGDPNWSKPNNYKIKQNDAIYDVEIVPNKGVKGDVSAQPFNDKNAEDIEDALVSLDDDLAFVEADYINNAEHALKQNITDNGLNTTNKTVVGAINEVKSEGEYRDLLQDDAIAIVNNKINALPMNGSLKNIRTSLVGIPTTFTNIDMFNTKQTVTNYQPLSLDYKGAAEPHIILMKTIGDYTFDFAVEATHTNGTDTTIILEAWVDGVLYDTATRTLVGGSNQINGVTGFFTYSKGTDTVPSEIYFRFKASQGNTSANKTLINTNLLGNSSENSFTDTDHVTGIGLNEPTYNGATTSFIINDLDARDNEKLPTAGGTMTGGLNFGLNMGSSIQDTTKHIRLHDTAYGFGVYDASLNYTSGGRHTFMSHTGAEYGRVDATIDTPKSLITKEYADLNYTPRNTNLTELGFGNTDFDSYTSLEDIIYDIIVTTNLKYGEVPVTIENYISSSTHANIFELMKAEINNDPNWIDVNWGNAVLKIHSANFNEGSSGMHEVTMYGNPALERFYLTTFSPNTKTFRPWTNEKGETQDIYEDRYAWSLISLGFVDSDFTGQSFNNAMTLIENEVSAKIGNNKPYEVAQVIVKEHSSANYFPILSDIISADLNASYGKPLPDGKTCNFKLTAIMNYDESSIEYDGGIVASIETTSDVYTKKVQTSSSTKWCDENGYRTHAVSGGYKKIELPRIDSTVGSVKVVFSTPIDLDIYEIRYDGITAPTGVTQDYNLGSPAGFQINLITGNLYYYEKQMLFNDMIWKRLGNSTGTGAMWFGNNSLEAEYQQVTGTIKKTASSSRDGSNAIITNTSETRVIGGAQIQGNAGDCTVLGHMQSNIPVSVSGVNNGLISQLTLVSGGEFTNFATIDIYIPEHIDTTSITTTPAVFLNNPINLPGIGDNMQDTNEVATND